jgi:hypothetical protein
MTTRRRWIAISAVLSCLASTFEATDATPLDNSKRYVPLDLGRYWIYAISGQDKAEPGKLDLSSANMLKARRGPAMPTASPT